MISSAQRKQQMKHFHITAMVIGVFLALGGLYFIFVISGQTNRKNAECTGIAQGVVSEVTPSGSKFKTTVDYEIEGFDKSVTFESKKDLGVGSQIEVRYEPDSWSHLYIEGVSSTGKDNIVFGLITILAGAAFFAYGFIVKRNKDRKKAENNEP